MPGVFDRLNTAIEKKKKLEGVSALDLIELPLVLRRVMRLLLREIKMSYPRLCEVVDALPEGQGVSREDLQRALDELTEQYWLVRIGQGEKAIYRVNLRAKRKSKLDETIWSTLEARGVWSALDAKLQNKSDDT